MKIGRHGKKEHPMRNEQTKGNAARVAIGNREATGDRVLIGHRRAIGHRGVTELPR